MISTNWLLSRRHLDVALVRWLLLHDWSMATGTRQRPARLEWSKQCSSGLSLHFLLGLSLGKTSRLVASLKFSFVSHRVHWHSSPFVVFVKVFRISSVQTTKITPRNVPHSYGGYPSNGGTGNFSQPPFTANEPMPSNYEPPVYWFRPCFTFRSFSRFIIDKILWTYPDLFSLKVQMKCSVNFLS